MLREGRNSGFRTVTVGGVVLGLFAVPLNRRLGSVEFWRWPQTRERTSPSLSRYLDQKTQPSYPIREKMYQSVLA